MKRRSILAGLGAAVAGSGLAYGRFRSSGREGRVYQRWMAADTEDGPGALRVLWEGFDDDGSTLRDIHPEYRGKFGDGGHVPERLHEELRRRYGSDEPYYMVRYSGRDCNGVPGDEGGDIVEVSRVEFNGISLGDCVKL